MCWKCLVWFIRDRCENAASSLLHPCKWPSVSSFPPGCPLLRALWSLPSQWVTAHPLTFTDFYLEVPTLSVAEVKASKSIQIYRIIYLVYTHTGVTWLHSLHDCTERSLWVFVNLQRTIFVGTQLVCGAWVRTVLQFYRVRAVCWEAWCCLWYFVWAVLV